MSKRIYRVRHILSSRHFRSSFALISAVVSAVYFLGCGVLYFQYRTARREAMEADLNRMAIAVQDSLNTMRNSAVFIGSIQSVEKLIALDHPGNDDFARMASELSPFFNLSSYEAVELFFERSGRIFVSNVGMYSWEDYFDPAFLRRLGEAESNEWWEVNRAYGRYYGEQYPMEVVTYVRKLPIYHYEQDGYVAVTVPLSVLQKTAEAAGKGDLGEAVLFFEGFPVYVSNQGIAESFDPSRPEEENLRLLLGNRQALSSTREMEVRGYGVPPSGFPPRARRYAAALGGVYLLLCCLAAGCALGYSRIMLRSVDRIMEKFALPPDPTGKRGSEFDLLGSMVDRLNLQMSAVQDNLRQNLPLVRERLISKLVCTDAPLKEVSGELGRYGLEFPHPYFSVILISLPELRGLGSIAAREDVRLLIREQALEALGGLGAVHCTYVEDENTLFLLNTAFFQGLEERIRRASRRLCARLYEASSLRPLFSVGICSPEDPVVYRAYIQAKRNLLFAYGSQEEFIQFGRQSEFTPALDEVVLGKLVQCVADHSQEGMASAVRLFQGACLAPCDGIGQARRITRIAVCNVYARALENNLPEREGQVEQALSAIGRAGSKEECGEELLAFLASLIHSEHKIPGKSRKYIYEAIRFIEDHYAGDITIPQIADNSAVSPIYLNRLFKLSTGKTISEYLNFHRIEASRRLLLETGETVNRISARVGYNDSRSYIRFFKKFHGLTPNEYRKRHGKADGEAAESCGTVSG